MILNICNKIQADNKDSRKELLGEATIQVMFFYHHQNGLYENLTSKMVT